MANRTANYSAFYVAEPFSPSNLGANATPDFKYYNILKAWKAADSSFPFVDAHAKTYSVRDDSDWEKTLKPRLHERLRASKNIILFLSSITANSKALREEITYGIQTCGLPVIVIYPEYKKENDISIIYPEYKKKNDISIGVGNVKPQISKLWDKLPAFRDNMLSVPTVHIPMDRNLILHCLSDSRFQVNTIDEVGIYTIT